jgi:hypothetical protein
VFEAPVYRDFLNVTVTLRRVRENAAFPCSDSYPIQVCCVTNLVMLMITSSVEPLRLLLLLLLPPVG